MYFHGKFMQIKPVKNSSQGWKRQRHRGSKAKDSHIATDGKKPVSKYKATLLQGIQTDRTAGHFNYVGSIITGHLHNSTLGDYTTYFEPGKMKMTATVQVATRKGIWTMTIMKTAMMAKAGICYIPHPQLPDCYQSFGRGSQRERGKRIASIFNAEEALCPKKLDGPLLPAPIKQWMQETCFVDKNTIKNCKQQKFPHESSTHPYCMKEDPPFQLWINHKREESASSVEETKLMRPKFLHKMVVSAVTEAMTVCNEVFCNRLLRKNKRMQQSKIHSGIMKRRMDKEEWLLRNPEWKVKALLELWWHWAGFSWSERVS